MSEELKAAQARIACLEGEIAKRDGELAACRIAVENCELFRARIAELEARIVWLECEAQVNAAPVSEAKAQGEYGDAYQGAREDLAIWKRRALEAEKALQEERIITERLGNALNEENGPTFMGEPVFPAKAQGVVMQSTDGGRNPRYEGLFDGETEEQRASRLNATPVQQVSVPDVSAMARILADRNADACNVNREDNWAIYGQDYIDDVTAMLAAAPAAPAADAGLVAVEWAKDAEEWGPALNEAGWLFLSELNEDPQKSALIFNNTKGPLRAAIMKYAEIVTAHRAQEAVR